jgi:hypothetical protein
MLIFFTSNPFSARGAIDHSTYDALLNQYVSGGFFDYKQFVEDEQSVRNLNEYLETMSEVQPEKLTQNERLAYWINLYNASTLSLVAKHYPIDSIRDLGGWITSVFEKQFIEANGRTLSLDNVEHDIIRQRFDEPRIHAALVCAARSCPPLRDEAYVGSKLNSQLEDQSRRFILSDRNKFKIQNGMLHAKLSMIFYWYGDDFGGEAGVLDFAADYLSRRKAQLIKNDQYTVSYQEYDWSLNQAPGPY